LHRLLQLHRRADVTVCVAGLEQARILADVAGRATARLKVFIEAEVGMQRCGADGDQAVALARWIARAPALELTGIMGYEGHAIGTKDGQAREHKAAQAHRRLAHIARAIRAEGIELPVVSAAGTGTFNLGVSPEELTEIQPGSYCLMDADYYDFVNVRPFFAPAASVLATVIDRPTSSRVVLDVGVKGISVDQGLPRPHLRGDLEPEEIHEEHYCLRLRQPDASPAVGESIELLPTHICTTVNLYDCFHVTANGMLVDTWPIDARGRCQ
jgi:D-serine deaminase-like pyridoxal phosphate-dependent protein